MLKEKIGLCPYEFICNEADFILMPEIQDDIEEFRKENKEPMKIKSSEESTNKAIKIKSPEEAIEIKSPEKDENTTNWYDKNKFKKITAVVISNKFNHKTKIKKFKYTDIRDLVDNINKNTIGETDAKIKLNALNELKNAETKNKRLSSTQKELLKLFADLLITVSNNNNNNNNNNDSNNNNNNSNNNENESGNVNDNDNENESESESESNNENNNDNLNESESESEDESEDTNEEYYKIKQLNGYFKMIDETKSFEKQINLFKKMNILEEYWHTRYYDDNKEVNLKTFKAKFLHIFQIKLTKSYLQKYLVIHL